MLRISRKKYMYIQYRLCARGASPGKPCENPAQFRYGIYGVREQYATERSV